MGLKAAMWVHGSILQTSDVTVTVERNEVGTVVTTSAVVDQDHLHDVHFPITTPVILDDARPQLRKVFVFYATDSLSSIRRIDIMDGPNRVKTFETNLSGDHRSRIDEFNSFVVDPPLTIFFGLAISVFVRFLTKLGQSQIIFTTAGADFADSIIAPPPAREP